MFCDSCRQSGWCFVTAADSLVDVLWHLQTVWLMFCDICRQSGWCFVDSCRQSGWCFVDSCRQSGWCFVTSADSLVDVLWHLQTIWLMFCWQVQTVWLMFCDSCRQPGSVLWQLQTVWLMFCDICRQPGSVLWQLQTVWLMFECPTVRRQNLALKCRPLFSFPWCTHRTLWQFASCAALACNTTDGAHTTHTVTCGSAVSNRCC